MFRFIKIMIENLFHHRYVKINDGRNECLFSRKENVINIKFWDAHWSEIFITTNDATSLKESLKTVVSKSQLKGGVTLYLLNREYIINDKISVWTSNIHPFVATLVLVDGHGVNINLTIKDVKNLIKFL